ncbi:hypothetical protein [Paraherbaspirillum soli]|uniref:Uncharacterized protein n=1 Tax=Paraherbaspirillum soli TaxID=631222 RepID=A0ABW0MHN7_9BURK
MSLTFNLEADQQLTREVVIAVLKASGVNCIVEEEWGLSCNFPRSNMLFAFRNNNNSFPTEVLAEGISSPALWKVGARLSFTYVVANYDDCGADLHLFLNNLMELNSAYFILSFQYEGVYAIRDEKGFKIFEKF